MATGPCSQPVEVGRRGCARKELGIAGSKLATAFTSQGSYHHIRTTRRVAVGDEPVNEVDDVIRESNGDLPGHPKTVPIRYHIGIGRFG